MPRTIVMIGGFTHEGVTAAAEAIGYHILSVALDRRTPATWSKQAKKMAALADAGDLAGTVLYLHSTLLLQASQEPFQKGFSEILEQARRAKAIAFIFQDNLDGIFAIRHWETREPMTILELEEQRERLGSL